MFRNLPRRFPKFILKFFIIFLNKIYCYRINFLSSAVQFCGLDRNEINSNFRKFNLKTFNLIRNENQNPYVKVNYSMNKNKRLSNYNRNSDSFSKILTESNSLSSFRCCCGAAIKWAVSCVRCSFDVHTCNPFRFNLLICFASACAYFLPLWVNGASPPIRPSKLYSLSPCCKRGKFYFGPVPGPFKDLPERNIKPAVAVSVRLCRRVFCFPARRRPRARPLRRIHRRGVLLSGTAALRASRGSGIRIGCGSGPFLASGPWGIFRNAYHNSRRSSWGCLWSCAPTFPGPRRRIRWTWRGNRARCRIGCRSLRVAPGSRWARLISGTIRTEF